jgi:hypothetical protein
MRKMPDKPHFNAGDLMFGAARSRAEAESWSGWNQAGAFWVSVVAFLKTSAHQRAMKGTDNGKAFEKK